MLFVCPTEAEYRSVARNLARLKVLSKRPFYLAKGGLPAPACRPSGRDSAGFNRPLPPVYLLKAGVGKVVSACATQWVLGRHPVRAVAEFGCAGAISPDVRLGDIILGDKVVQHDVLEAHPGRHSRKYFSASTSGEITKAIHANLRRSFPRVRKGVIASGDKDVFAGDAKEGLWKGFGALCVTWESAAIGKVCELNGVSYVVGRVISDLADESMLETYSTQRDTVLEKASGPFLHAACAAILGTRIMGRIKHVSPELPLN